jgi:DNA-binding NarL/FixJ family response regulator
VKELDLRLLGLSGIEASIAIRAEFPNARIIILTTFDGAADVQRALLVGACGYFLKTAQIVEHMGEARLSATETEALRLIAAGHGNRDIGERLLVSRDTVKLHLKRIKEKPGAKDRNGAVVLAERRGIIRLDADSPNAPPVTNLTGGA